MGEPTDNQSQKAKQLLTQPTFQTGEFILSESFAVKGRLHVQNLKDAYFSASQGLSKISKF